MRILVHIGAGKCGSSSIQALLQANRAALLGQGFLIPPKTLVAGDEVTGHHVGYFQAKRKLKPSDAGADFQRDISAIQASAPPHVHAILLSAENLSNPGPCLAEMFAPLADRLHVIAYIRRQDDFLESAWWQWHRDSFPDAEAWLKTGRTATLGDWRASLEPWVNMAAEVHVRRYSNDVVADYASIIGVDMTGLAAPVRANVTPKDGRGWMSSAHRIEVMDGYAESNNWVRDTFFPERVGLPLFDDPQRA